MTAHTALPTNLANIDDMVTARYKTSHPAFHAGYLGARTIIDLHGPGDDDEDPVPDPDPDPVP